jgi:single-stranded DNA-binding protein
MNNYLNKGSLIAIDGKLEVYRTERDGNFETRTNVNVQSVQFLESRAQSQERQSETRQETQQATSTTGVTFAKSREDSSSNTMKENETPQNSNPEKVIVNFDEIKF